ncbi:MAG: 1-acyl-sn-glycerol-3-phosphate acyltransferase [Candidatus Omnitrophota bacterium]|nr:MAG: 1-acyl-sn-glycerol-3-phosphate acyltransferase [Candidatus Omnitrophota bacterium]
MTFYCLSKFLFGLFAKIFLRLKVEGEENLPEEGGFILAANHASSLDPFIVTAAIPRYIRWMVVYEYYDKWYLRRILRRMRFIRIENNLPKEVFRALKSGDIVGFFPEGRRSWDGRLGQARSGVAALARASSCPVIPVAIRGTFAALPRTRKFLKFSPVTVRIGAPLTFAKVANRKDRQRRDEENTGKIMDAIAKLLY